MSRKVCGDCIWPPQGIVSSPLPIQSLSREKFCFLTTLVRLFAHSFWVVFWGILNLHFIPAVLIFCIVIYFVCGSDVVQGISSKWISFPSPYFRKKVSQLLDGVWWTGKIMFCGVAICSNGSLCGFHWEQEATIKHKSSTDKRSCRDFSSFLRHYLLELFHSMEYEKVAFKASKQYQTVFMKLLKWPDLDLTFSMIATPF